MIASTQNNEIQNITFNIASELAKSTLNSEIGLHSGFAGHVLFLGHLYMKFEKTNHYDLFMSKLDICIERLSTDSLDSSLYNGFTGVLWVIRHFIRLGLLKKSDFESLEDLEDIIIESCRHDCTYKHYDLLNGMIGKGVYLIECEEEEKSKLALEKMVQQLDSFAILDSNYKTWNDPMLLPGRRSTFSNLGLAHGVPSIIIFLAKLHKKKIARELTSTLLQQSVPWLLKQMTPFGTSLFSYNTCSVEESRLAWCYGDLGPAMALLQAGTALDQQEWIIKAVEISIKAGQRQLESSGVKQDPEKQTLDNGFCHGTTGISLLYSRLYEKTQVKEFKTIAEYWLSFSIDNLGQSVISNRNTPFGASADQLKNGKPSLNLLEGLCGIGLVLLDKLNQKSLGWDSIFLTDFM